MLWLVFHVFAIGGGAFIVFLESAILIVLGTTGDLMPPVEERSMFEQPIPHIGLLIMGLALFAVMGSVSSEPADGGNLYVWYAGTILTRFNLFILIFNLIPLYPLDGGRTFQALAWGYLLRRGESEQAAYARSLFATLWAARVTAVLGREGVFSLNAGPASCPEVGSYAENVAVTESRGVPAEEIR